MIAMKKLLLPLILALLTHSLCFALPKEEGFLILPQGSTRQRTFERGNVFHNSSQNDTVPASSSQRPPVVFNHQAPETNNVNGSNLQQAARETIIHGLENGFSFNRILQELNANEDLSSLNAQTSLTQLAAHIIDFRIFSIDDLCQSNHILSSNTKNERARALRFTLLKNITIIFNMAVKYSRDQEGPGAGISLKKLKPLAPDNIKSMPIEEKQAFIEKILSLTKEFEQYIKAGTSRL